MLGVGAGDIDDLTRNTGKKGIENLGEIEMQSWGGWPFSVKDPAGIPFWFWEPLD